MLSVSQFAQIAGVTVRQLHHYDRLGLFKPAHVARESGYRFYTLAQLPLLHRILSLRELGLPLEQIATLLYEGLDNRGIAVLLHKHQSRLEARIRHDRARWHKTALRLSYLDTETPYQDVVVKMLPAASVLLLSTTLRLGETLTGLFESGFDALVQQQKANAVRTVVGIYPQHSPILGKVIQPFPVEAAYFVSRSHLRPLPLDDDRKLVPARLDGVARAACLLHKGDYNRLFESYRGLLGWIQAQGYTVTGAPREVYLCHRTVPSQRLTEIQLPIAPAPHRGSIPENVLT